LLHGGAQQLSKRPGTEDVALAIGMRTALAGWVDNGPTRRVRMEELRDRFEDRLRSQVEDLVIIGKTSSRLPQTSLIAFPHLNRQAIFMAADLQGLAISMGSACASGSSEPSPTLRAMGLETSVIEGAVRISFGFQTRADELDFAADQLAAIATNLGRKQPAFGGSRPSRRA
jgi:cysteine desulfurase